MIQLPVICNLDELLSKGLSDSVGSLFCSGTRIPFSHAKISAVDQTVPPKWQTEIPIDDTAFLSSKPANLPVARAPWNPNKLLEAALVRLGIDKQALAGLDHDEAIVARFGESQLAKAKRSIKNELREFDAAFKAENGREATRADKEPMRALYTLYRRLRELASKLDEDAEGPNLVVDAAAVRLEALYEEKQSVRAILQEYQARFLSEQGRRIKYHRDIVAVDREYRQYKQLKEEIAKLEVQLGRRPRAVGNDGFFS